MCPTKVCFCNNRKKRERERERETERETEIDLYDLGLQGSSLGLIQHQSSLPPPLALGAASPRLESHDGLDPNHYHRPPTLSLSTPSATCSLQQHTVLL